MATSGVNMVFNAHTWCINEEGRVYDYDDRMLRKTCFFFFTGEVVWLPAEDGPTSLLMPMLENAFNS